MPLAVVLVRPKFSGNIGSVARVMANFDLSDLRLVDPEAALNEEAKRLAVHAVGILESARRYETVKAAVQDSVLTVGTSGRVNTNDRNHLRNPITPRRLVDRLRPLTESGERVCLLFGREDSGLLSEELRLCDMLVTIPASEKYPVLNLSHSVAVILYELFVGLGGMPRYASSPETLQSEKTRFIDQFDAVLRALSWPEHKKDSARILWQRMIARGGLTSWEYHTLMGVLKRAEREIRRAKGEPDEGDGAGKCARND